MKGRAVTSEQKAFHNLLAREIGCVACARLGIFNDYVSIHHIAGRTSAIAHWLVLPLCGPHHQDSGLPGYIAIHPWKKRFELEFGTQMRILAQCIQTLIERGKKIPDEALKAAGLHEKAAVAA